MAKSSSQKENLLKETVRSLFPSKLDLREELHSEIDSWVEYVVIDPYSSNLK